MELSIRAVATAPTPSEEPRNPRPSVVVAPTLTGAPTRADKADSTSSLLGESFGLLPIS